jgi:hypothetical protein
MLIKVTSKKFRLMSEAAAPRAGTLWTTLHDVRRAGARAHRES